MRLGDVPGLDLVAVARANVPLPETQLPSVALPLFPGFVPPRAALDLQHIAAAPPAVGEIPRIKLPTVKAPLPALLSPRASGVCS